MSTIIVANPCQTIGTDLFDQVKSGCSLPVQKKTSCGCKTEKKNCGCGCNSHITQNTMEVTGKVIDKATKQPLIGAHILNQESQQGSVTDDNGNFALQAASDDLLKISFVGMKDVTLPASQIDLVEMEEDSALDEVIITAKKSIKNHPGLWVGIGLVSLYAYAKTRKPKRVSAPKKPING